MSDSNPFQSGQKAGAGRFTLVRALGRGGMGEVWLAQDERLEESVALKFLPPEVRADPVALDDLRRETARSHGLTHPNIVRIHDLHEEPGGTAFIAMEYVDGPTLAGLRLEQPERVLSWEFLRPLVQQLCAALDYAHGEKVVHRDLKPANIMVDSKGRLKLADFGIAATVSDSVNRVSGRQATSGTLPYMSPQQLAGKYPQVADDIYALGATLYELLTSQPPFYTGDITHQVLHESPEPPDERLAALGLVNAVPPDVAALIMACLAKEPAQRPQGARAVAGWIGLEVVSKPSLQSLASELFGEARSGDPVGPLGAGHATPPPPSSRRSLLLAGVAAVALVLVALGGWYWTARPSVRRGHPAKAQVVIPGPDSSSVPAESAPPAATAMQDIPGPNASTPAALETGSVSLFNGHDFAGWKLPDPNPFWRVSNGLIVGLQNEAHDYFVLETDRHYRDVIVELEFRLTGDMDSGLLLRAQGPDEWQCQIGYSRSTKRDTTGSIWSNRRYVAVSAEGPKLVRKGDWNKLRIRAEGPHFTIWVNDGLALDYTNPSFPRAGAIALQNVTGDKGGKVEFRNLRAMPLNNVPSQGNPAPAVFAWIPLFDGRTLSGWTTPDAPNNGGWRVSPDGALVSQGPTSHLFCPQTYTNLEFKAEIKLSPGANGGMYFRAQRYPVKGYEAQSCNGGASMVTGSLYAFQAAPGNLAADGAWFTQHVIAIGNRIVIKVNDRMVVDYTDLRHTYSSGHLALQHRVPPANSTTSYRNVMIKPLPADETLAWAEARKDMPDLAR